MQHLHLRRSLPQPVSKLLRSICVNHDGIPGAKAQTLFGQLVDAGIGRQRLDSEFVWMARDHIERIYANRAGRAKHGDTRRSVHGQHIPVMDSGLAAREIAVRFINPAT
jgi:hypothetical protein